MVSIAALLLISVKAGLVHVSITKEVNCASCMQLGVRLAADDCIVGVHAFSSTEVGVTVPREGVGTG